MRPRKTVLILTGDPVEASLVRFQLDVWHYAPMWGASVSAAQRLLATENVDLALCFGDSWETFILEAQAKYPHLVFVVVGHPIPDGQADRYLQAPCSAFLLRETLKSAIRKHWSPPLPAEVGDGIAAD